MTRRTVGAFLIFLALAGAGIAQPASGQRNGAIMGTGNAPSKPGWSTLSAPLREEPGSALLSLDLIDSLERERNFPLALSVLGDLLEEFPENPLLLLKRGSLRLLAGRLLEAKDDFEKVLAQGKKIPDALYGLVRVQEQLQDWERSLVICQDILSEDSGNAFAVLHAGWANFRMNRFEEALKWYSREDLFHRRNMCLGRGWAQIRLNDLARARQAFEEVTASAPQDPEALSGIREVERLQLTGQLEAAPTTDLLPRLREQGRGIEALQLSEALLAKEPMNSTVLLERALLFSANGNWAEVEQCYSLLLAKEPKPEYLRGRMSALYTLGRLAEASAAAKETLKAAPHDTFALKIIADDLYALGKFDKALEYYEKLPEGLWAWQGKGWCHLILGNLPLARKAFQNLLVHYPGNTAALEGLKRIGE